MKYDLVIVGTGQAGVPLATRLAKAGRRVLIVERGAAGGTCVNNGCTPTKTMIASARAAHVARTASQLGVRLRDVEVDLEAVVDRKDAMVTRWRQGVERRLAAGGENLRFVRGQARFVAPRIIEVAGDRHEGERVVINVGARAAVPAIEGLAAIPWMNSTRLLGLRHLPRHLLVLGGGYIGCELGQMFRRFGSAVTILEPSERILAREDPDVSEALQGAFAKEGITLTLGCRVERVARDGEDIVLGIVGGGPEAKREIRGTHLLVAAGRRPNTDDLGCAAGGIALDERGAIEVDEHYETTAPGTYAVGDCTPGPQFTHVSWDDHRVLYDVLTGRPARRRGDRIVPYAIFTDPQVAGVGLSASEASARNSAVEIATMPFGAIARAVETDETAGVVKVIVDPSSDRILGARIVGADAGELIHVFAILMQARASIRAIVDGEFVHPTFAEGLQTAVMKLPRYALS